MPLENYTVKQYFFVCPYLQSVHNISYVIFRNAFEHVKMIINQNQIPWLRFTSYHFDAAVWCSLKLSFGTTSVLILQNVNTRRNSDLKALFMTPYMKGLMEQLPKPRYMYSKKTCLGITAFCPVYESTWSITAIGPQQRIKPNTDANSTFVIFTSSTFK